MSGYLLTIFRFFAFHYSSDQNYYIKFKITSYYFLLIECRGKIDIVFLIDNSWSVLKPNFDKLKDFVTTTAYDLRPLSQDHVLIGVDVFSKKAITEISLKDCNDFWSFRQAVFQIPFQGGPTNTHCALENALWNSFSEDFGELFLVYCFKNVLLYSFSEVFGELFRI